MVVGYDSNEGGGEERDRFRNDMDITLDNVGNRYRLCILGELNGWRGDRTRAGITGALGVPGENDNRRRAVEFTQKGESLHKYTRVARDQDGVEIKSMMWLLRPSCYTV